MRLSGVLLAALLVASSTAGQAEQLAPQRGFAAQFLIAQQAERENDWSTASLAITALGQSDPANREVSHSRMLLALNLGQFDEALAMANRFGRERGQPHLAFLIQFGAAAKANDLVAVKQLRATLDDDSIARFIKPFFNAWIAVHEQNFSAAKSALAKTEPVGQLRQAARFHLALIGQLLGKTDETRTALSQLLIETPDTRTVLAAHAFYVQHDMLMQKAGLARAAQRAGLDPILQAYLAGTPEAGAKPPVLAYGFSQVLYDLASLLYSEGASDLALPYLRVAQALQPENADITLMLAEMLAKLEQIPEARQLYATLTSRADVGGVAALRLAALDLEHGDGAQARQQLADLVQRYPSWVGARALLADSAARQHNPLEAVTAYTQALSVLPDDAAASVRVSLLQARAQNLMHLEDKALVEADLTAALVLAPDNAELLNHLGYLWAEQGRELTKAEELLRKANDLSPSSAHILDSLGWVLFRQGRAGEAISWLEQAIELNPYDDTINDHLGDAYWAAGRKAEARFQWQRAITYRTTDQPMQVSLEDLKRKLEQGLALRVSAERH